MSGRFGLWPVALLATASSFGAVSVAMAPGAGAMGGGCTHLQRGSDGRDILVGTTAGDRLTGRAGRDRISGRSGDDCLLGGAQRDLIRGGAGRDRVNPGRGQDVVESGGADDRVNARDGRRDLVRCGSGTDTALVDGRDTVKGCENTPTPDTTITSGPSGTVAYGSPVTFEFSSSSKLGPTFECHINAWARWKPCDSPKTYPRLGAGHRTFNVRATDRAGDVDPTPDSQSFTIGASPPPPDTTPPETSIDSFQINADNSITFAFSSDPPDVQVLSRVDPSTIPTGCPAEPNTCTTSPLPTGDHTLTVWAVVNGVADPTPAVQTFTITPSSHPPPSPDDPPFLSEMLFPRHPGTPGTALPENASDAGIDDFDALDFDSVRDSNNVNDRMSWVPDPGGSNNTVAEIRLEAGDHADGSDASGDHRAEIYQTSRDNGNHEVGWQVLGFRVPPGNPGSYGIFQNHGGSRGTGCAIPPPQNLSVLSNGSLAVGIREDAPGRAQHVIGSGAPDVWHYVVMHIRFDAAHGFVEAWEADNALPDVSRPPAFSKYDYATLHTCNPGPGATHIGFYESNLSFAARIFYCGYHRAATYAEASRLPSCVIATGG